MPVFKRSDGKIIKNLSVVRRIMPYLMKSRNESVVYHEQTYDITNTLKWLEAFNVTRGDKPAATLFHLYLWACANTTHENPGLNRFVAGNHIYQRNEVEISFTAKKSFDLKSPLVTVKVAFSKEEAFGDTVDRIFRLTGEGRKGKDSQGKERHVDKEVKVLMKLPGFLLRWAIGLVRFLDGFNLMPASMIKNDPMYASIFIANLGSVGLDNTFHHLYEHGTVPLFGCMGRRKKHQFISDDGKAEIRDAVQVRWSFDERVNDGFYCASTLKLVQTAFENPEKYMRSSQSKAKFGAASSSATKTNGTHSSRSPIP